MTYEVRSGWIYGKLPGPGERMFDVEHHERRDQSAVRLSVEKPNLVLHTTESPDLGTRYEGWPYPPQLAVGDFRIVQLFPLWAQGKSSKAQDAYAMQIEIAGYSKGAPWLPARASLDPLAALVAFLHAEQIIRTGLERPTDDWPVEMDYRAGSGFPASYDYYRRKAGLWPQTPGVYGHIELPGDNHYDPGGFDYPAFFELVLSILGGDDVTFDEWHAGFEAHEAGKDVKESWSSDKKDGWRDRNVLVREAVAKAKLELSAAGG